MESVEGCVDVGHYIKSAHRGESARPKKRSQHVYGRPLGMKTNHSLVPSVSSMRPRTSFVHAAYSNIIPIDWRIIMLISSALNYLFITIIEAGKANLSLT